MLIGSIAISIWYEAFYVPFDWVRYTNTKNYSYSFSHLKEWVVNECRNGEVVVAKKKLEQCYYPLDASESYLADVYFHIFPPKNKQLSFNWDEGNTREQIYSGALQNWRGIHWYWDYGLFANGILLGWRYERIWGEYGSLVADSAKYQNDSEIVPQKERTYPQVHTTNEFNIGYMANNISEEEMHWLLNSFKDH